MVTLYYWDLRSFDFYRIGPIILTVRMIWQAVRMIILKRAHHLRLMSKLVQISSWPGSTGDDEG